MTRVYLKGQFGFLSTRRSNSQNNTDRPNVHLEAVPICRIKEDFRCNVVWRSTNRPEFWSVRAPTPRPSPFPASFPLQTMSLHLQFLAQTGDHITEPSTHFFRSPSFSIKAANPRSPTLTFMSASKKMFPSFKSRWMIFVECMYWHAEMSCVK
jgi:hypothetical protein